MMNPDKKNQISLEDLLRLKRAERPPAEFWPQFERELRAKQLAAIMVQRPWWRTLPSRALARFARYHLPLGATAVLALTLMTVRQYQSNGVTRNLAGNLSRDVVGEVGVSGEGDVATHSPMAITISTSASEGYAAANTEATEVAVTDSAGAAPEILAGDVSAMSALVGGPAGAEHRRVDSPSARSIAENFTTTRSSDSSLDRALLGAPHGFESRVLPARNVDPLAQVTPPSEVRRSRYLGTALPVSGSQGAASSRSGERLVSRLSDDRLYDSVSRYAFGGSQVSLMVKF